MSFITVIINKIKTATLGSEVRSSIADGLEMISENQNDLKETFNQLIIDKGNSNAEIAASRYDSKTNTSYKTLPERLDSMSLDISDKADMAFVDTMLANAISGGPDGIYNTLADLQKAFPNGATGDFVVVDTEHLYIWNGAAWQDAGPYNGVEVGDNSISKQKTSFIKLSQNRFNKNDMLFGQYYDDQGNLIINNNFNTPKPILVKGGVKYIVGLTEFLDVCFWSSRMIPVSGVAAGTWNGILDIPSNASYVTFGIRNTVNLDYLMVVEGTTLPSSYIPYEDTLEENIFLSDGAVSKLVQKEELGIRKSRNLFDKDKIKMGFEIYADGSIRAQSQSATTDEIYVFGETNLYISGLTPYATGIDSQGFFYDKLGTPIGSVLKISKSLKEISIPIPTEAYWFATSIYQRKTSAEVINWDTIQIEYGTSKTEYTRYDEKVTTIGALNIDLADDVKTEYILKSNLQISPLKNLFDKSKVVTGYEIYSDGTLKAEPNSAYYKLEGISGMKDISLSGLPTYSTGLTRRQGQFYDANNQIVGTLVYVDKGLSEITIPVVEGSSYFIFTIYQRKTSTEIVNLDTIQFEEGSEVTEFEDFTYGIDKIDGMKIKGTDNGSNSTVKTEGKIGFFIGDSITETADIAEDGSIYTEGTRSNWPAFTRVSLKLGEVWNYARRGASYKKQNIVGDRRKSISEQITMFIEKGITPDIIIAAGGTNDGIENLGDYETAMAKETLESLDLTNFYEAIRWAFWTLRQHYPHATCYAATPLQRKSREPLPELSEAIKKMANRYGFIVVDVEYESGITRENIDLFTSDGLHPNVDGQIRESKCFDAKILSTYNPV